MISGFRMGRLRLMYLESKSRSPSSSLSPFLGQGSPTKIDYRRKGAFIQTSLVEDLEVEQALSIERLHPQSGLDFH